MAKRGDFVLNSMVGPGSKVAGNIESAGFTRVDGSIQGNINSKGGVIIGSNSRLKGDIRGTAVTVSGVVQGNILASERITVLATGLVLGDIITMRIQADDGCLIDGRIVVCQNSEQWDQAIAEYQDREKIRFALSGNS
ncbi:MAG: polymer-forming cytoskeletal protein [Treponema sp.]|jgi:cytoskeletal protein CcmA (bactofilin family)|nr:polymer-forming cytoskeletal protein [Treponema sp.]